MTNPRGYNSQVEQFRDVEYPALKGVVYLDHAGTALPPKSLMEKFAIDMVNQLWCNPHSTSTAAQSTSKRIERVRLQLLSHFQADPEEFDLVFVANATAGVKLVAEAFRDAPRGFWYGYHAASHTSLVGVREISTESQCFASDEAVELWLSRNNAYHSTIKPRLFAYPAQSNMNGRRLPLSWCRKLRNLGGGTYSLLDAAALISTSSLNFQDAECAPDFTVVSLYKAFGFPDLGALIVRKASASIFRHRRYFGGGTVDVASCDGDVWHKRKTGTLHEALEDGSLPIHNILALEAALATHAKLFGPIECVSTHCAVLSQRLYDGLAAMRHWNKIPVSVLYHKENCDFRDGDRQGPIVALNLCNSDGGCIGTTEVEKLASIKNIQLRTGQLCNPGGVAQALQLTATDLKLNYAAGQRCGNDQDIMRGRPTGMVRLSLGPENTLADVDQFLAFVMEFFLESASPESREFDADQTPDTGSARSSVSIDIRSPSLSAPVFSVESLTIYPIKSCCGWRIPKGKSWEVRPEGLALDREWCVVRAGDGAVMSQKRYAKMALIRPTVDIKEGLLRLEFADKSAKIAPIAVPLSAQPSIMAEWTDSKCRSAQVCGDDINASVYIFSDISRFFTEALGVSCTLGRFPPSSGLLSARHAKPHLLPTALNAARKTEASHGPTPTPNESSQLARPILLSNESPILIVSRSSINRLNEQIKVNGGKAVGSEAFRPNIVIAESNHHGQGVQMPYAEDGWHMITVGGEAFELLGRCRRCQMVCIDQDTGMRNQEPFVTLAKTRRLDGKVYFGQHACHVGQTRGPSGPNVQKPMIAVGDLVLPTT